MALSRWGGNVSDICTGLAACELPLMKLSATDSEAVFCLGFLVIAIISNHYHIYNNLDYIPIFEISF